MRYAGEVAALGTTVCYAVAANLFAAAGARLGSAVLNRLRILTALVFLTVALLVTRGVPWPVWATRTQVVWLGLSGLVGFVFGDTNYFRALVILGPSRAALLMSLAPVFTALLAWPVLGEVPGPKTLLGMALTVGGIMWVVQARKPEQAPHVEGSIALGVLSGVLGAVGQAGGMVLSKMALRTGIDPLSATVVRVAAGVAGIWVLTAAQGQTSRTFAALRDRSGALFMVSGAMFGPFLGVTLTLVSMKFIEAGVSASITAAYPLVAIAIATRFHGERLGARLVLGALVTVAGVVVLFLR